MGQQFLVVDPAKEEMRVDVPIMPGLNLNPVGYSSQGRVQGGFLSLEGPAHEQVSP